MEIKEIRKELIAKREQLSPSVIIEASITVTQDLLNHPQFQQFDTIYIYLPVRNEIDTSYLITKALQANKTVAVPVILSKEDMVFQKINGTGKYHEDRYHILEPVYDPKSVIDRPGLMIVPLVGFSGRRRIGYGGQYFNNYLKHRKNLYTIGVGYQFQSIPELPEDDRDILLNEIRSY